MVEHVVVDTQPLELHDWLVEQDCDCPAKKDDDVEFTGVNARQLEPLAQVVLTAFAAPP